MMTWNNPIWGDSTTFPKTEQRPLQMIGDVAFRLNERIPGDQNDSFILTTARRRWERMDRRRRDVATDQCEITRFEFKNVWAGAQPGAQIRAGGWSESSANRKRGL